MQNIFIKLSLIFVMLFSLTACVTTTQTKQEIFPRMYDEGSAKQNILIAPIINESTSSEASEYLNSTIAEPFVNKGYYVFPIPITADIFKQSGIIDGKELKGIPFGKYKEQFGADAILFVTISQWDTNYLIVSGNVEVGLKYVMVSTETSEIIWSYENTVVVDTSSSSGSLLVDLIATAITTATTDYVPIAKRVNVLTSNSLPVGAYHPRFGKDMTDLVMQNKATAAADNFVK